MVHNICQEMNDDLLIDLQVLEHHNKVEEIIQTRFHHGKNEQRLTLEHLFFKVIMKYTYTFY